MGRLGNCSSRFYLNRPRKRKQTKESAKGIVPRRAAGEGPDRTGIIRPAPRPVSQHRPRKDKLPERRSRVLIIGRNISDLLDQVLSRENMLTTWKRVKATNMRTYCVKKTEIQIFTAVCLLFRKPLHGE